ncbi:hypothetical protein BDB01DRAFT_787840 [Pilobolus umbonatus]|nr:hypothetical protein BDB01DRAFT_787840 [Pilobolus umbonatus]
MKNPTDFNSTCTTDVNYIPTPDSLVSHSTKLITKSINEHSKEEKPTITNQPAPIYTSWTDFKSENAEFDTFITTTPSQSATRMIRILDPEVTPTESLSSPSSKTQKKIWTREEKIEKQKQAYYPMVKSRCDYWPNCTNKHCKFWHPFAECREGDNCPFKERCMFLHPRDHIEPERSVSQRSSSGQKSKKNAQRANSTPVDCA